MDNAIVVILIENAGLLVAMVVVFDSLTARQERAGRPLRQTLTGLALGAIGIAMIQASVRFEAGIIFDTRSVLLAVSGLFLGTVPTAIAMLMTAAFRLLVGGVAAGAGVAVIFASGGSGILWRRLRRRPLEEVSWQDLYALGLVVHAVMLAILLTLPWDAAMRVLRTIGLPVLVVHPLATVALGMWLAQRLRHHRSLEELAKSEARFRLLAENAHESEERLRLALEAANQGLYDLNVQTGEATVSEEYARMLGYDPATFHETIDDWIERLHPDDRERVRAAYEDYVAGRVPKYRIEFRQRTRGGDWVWILSLGSIVSWDAAGKPLRLVGTHTDISAPKMAELEIRDGQAESTRLLGEAKQSRRALLSLVEDQQAAERRLLAAQQLAQSTLDALKEHICVLDEHGTVIAVNNAWRDFGAANGALPEATGSGADYLAVCDQASGSDADQAREFAAALRAVLSGQRDAFSVEYPCHSAQDQRWFEASVTRFAGNGPVRVVVAHENVTERKNAERDLRRLTQILEATQTAARVGGWELDLVHVTLFWTDETYRIHDTSPEQYTPTPDSVARFFPQDSIPMLREALREAVRTGSARDLETELITFTGRRKWIHITTSVIAEKGRTVRVTCAFQDITARKQAERERLELLAQLYHAQNLESLGSLAGGVAHDINNILAAILMSATAQRRRLEISESLARSLDTIISACVRGRSVVRSLLLFARGDIESLGPVDLNSIARELVQLLDNTSLKRIRYTLDLHEPLSRVDGDAAAISNAVMNLCVNSVDAMPDGGEVTIRTRPGPAGMVELSVRDTGVGMTPEVRGKAIEPFFTTKPVGKGTGLGLSMVYGTMKAHKGTFEIVSAPGKGSEVVLAFPASGGGEAAEPVPAMTPGAEAAASRRLRILLVDDDDLIRAGLGALLEMEGHEVRLAPGGAEAIAAFESGGEFDLVILDVNMPGLSGAQTLVRLLAIRPGQAVLMCSGHGDEAMAQLMTDRPNVLAIQKPFTLGEVEAKLAAFGFTAHSV